MKKYVCSICGYIYDEETGASEKGIAPGTKWEDIPENWTCPLCGATKAEFDVQQPANTLTTEIVLDEEHNPEEMHELSFGELSALCSNLAKGCEKQYRNEEAELFNKLSEYYRSKTNPVEDSRFEKLISLIQQDLNSGYPQSFTIARAKADRGALRALTWGEKVTKILNSLLARYEKQGEALLENTNVYVCEICGFLYIGDEPPAICPVCKVPSLKIEQIQRG